MNHKYVNLACGTIYLDDWINLDYSPHSSKVKKANLLGKIPIETSEASVVYSSHFLEHIPHKYVQDFISECYRITSRKGYIRLVLPDWEEMCR
ncbi:MAG: methyltransferase domain-containing protein, partial [Candidatus Paceibacterota bacterium]